jgi:oligopeptide transport system ATP-binding protein
MDMSESAAMAHRETTELLRVENLAVHFPVMGGGLLPRQVGVVQAVDGVSFTIRRGETLSIVGESGCGKSTTAMAVLRMQPVTAGRIWFDGQDITVLGPEALRPVRRRIQTIFQDPYASLNPRMKVGAIISEPLEVHRVGDGSARRQRVAELMKLVGLLPDMAERYPHEFSGGQRQRISIARALALEPDLVVCDEAVSALDVSIQAQILNLLMELQERLGLAYLFISHDLSVVRHISDRIAVMYLGRIVEIAERDKLFASARHPYTQALLAAAPSPDPVLEASRPAAPLTGEPPSPRNPPPGCRFHPRCPAAFAPCPVQSPALVFQDDSAGVACHLFPPQP